MGLSNLGMQSVLDSAQRIRRVTDDTCSNPNASGRIGLVWQMNILNEQIDSTFYFTWKNGGTAAFSSYICFAYDSSKNLKTGVVVLSNHLTPSCDYLGVQILRYLNSDTTTVGVGANSVSQNIPESFKLYQNYPNPFNPVTVIRYSLIENSLTNLKVFDALGREITTLVNEKQNAGIYEVEFDGSSLPSSVYFYMLTSGDLTETRKMFLVK
jgi:hypothetical protein